MLELLIFAQFLGGRMLFDLAMSDLALLDHRNLLEYQGVMD
jgi:hypothetical protein